ncbi:MDR family MFS transporter [Cellulomonas sp. McL0617]|uniref:MDR family MFS transporter n=1 Tax=Cellulomonas sp. McL0617 TaxID=3415675 RepID=UPI003CF7057F
MTTTTADAEQAPQSLSQPAGATSHRGVLLVFAGLLIAMLLASLDQMIFSTALPTIVGELHGVEHMVWVTTAYILASTIVMPVYGKLGDLVGRKWLFVSAIGIFLVGSVIGGLAHSMTTLIAGRAVQGLGGGGLMILALAIIADVVPARERGRYNGIMGAVFAVSSVAGPLLGGFFTEGPGWRWAFWMNVPLGILAIASAVKFIHLPKRELAKPRLDYAGMALIAIATTCIVLITTWAGSTYAWGSPQIIGMIAGAVVAGIAFVLVERRAAEPIMPLALFRNRNFNVATLGGLLTGISMFGALAYLPTYLQMVTGSSATEAGLLMVPMMLGLLLTSVITGIAISRTGTYKWYPPIGMVLVAVALFLLSTMTPGLAVWVICGYTAIMGVGLGMTMQNLVLVVQNSFSLKVVGTATSSNNYFRQIGASVGSAVVGSLFATNLAHLLTQRLPASGAGDTGSFTPDLVHSLPDQVREIIVGAYNDALTPVFLYMVPLAIAAAIVLVFIKHKPLATKIESEAVVESLDVDGTTHVALHADDALDAAELDAELDDIDDAELATASS